MGFVFVEAEEVRSWILEEAAEASEEAVSVMLLEEEGLDIVGRRLW